MSEEAGSIKAPREKADAAAFIVDFRTDKLKIVKLRAWKMDKRMVVPAGSTHLAFNLAVAGVRWMRTREGQPIPQYLPLIGRTPAEAQRKAVKHFEQASQSYWHAHQQCVAKKERIQRLLTVA